MLTGIIKVGYLFIVINTKEVEMKKAIKTLLWTTIIAGSLALIFTPAFSADRIISEIRVVGNRKLKDTYIVNSLGIEVGDSLVDDALEKWEDALKRIPAVENAIIKAFPAENERNVRLYIVISEKETRKISPELSRKITNRWSYGASYSDSNFRGRNETLKLKALTGGTNFFEASWGRRATYGLNRIGLIFTLSYLDYSYSFPDFKEILLNDRLKSFEFEAALSISLNPSIKIKISPGFTLYNVSEPMLEGQGKGSIPEVPDGLFSTIEYGLLINKLDKIVYPERGFLLSASRKDWGIYDSNSKIKNFQYHLKGIGATRLIKPILAIKTNAVITGGRAPIMLIQHIGGEGTIRGYEFGSISGPSAIYSTAEIRYPLNFEDFYDTANPLTLADFHIFIDSGATWDIKEKLTGNMFKTGFGVGINLIPNRSTVVIIDYAWTLRTSGRWQLDVRSSF